VIRPLEKPFVHGDCSIAFEFDLTTQSPDVIPTPKNTTVSITAAALLEMCDYKPWVGTTYQFNYGVVAAIITPCWIGEGDYGLYYSCDMVNMWNPKRADLTMDGHVDVDDLNAVIKKFWKLHGYAGLVTAFGDPSLVDIFDVVYVAKLFGDC